MSSSEDLVMKHFSALLGEAESAGVPTDVVGRHLLGKIVEAWLQERSWQDVADELHFTADAIDPERDFEFMRP